MNSNHPSGDRYSRRKKVTSITLKAFEEISKANVTSLRSGANQACHIAAEMRRVTDEISKLGKVEDRKTIESIVELISQDHSLSTEPDCIFSLITSATYFDTIGDARVALETTDLALELAKRKGDLNLKRKGNNFLGACHARLCNFEASAFHFEEALKLAFQLGDSTAQFAILSNIVTMLYAMGLYTDAISLALKLKNYPRGTPDLNNFHLQNSLNGFRLADLMNDSEAIEIFYADLRVDIESIAEPIGLLSAMYEANHAIYLQRHDKAAEAIIFLRELLNHEKRLNNPRIAVTLLSAAGYCYQSNANFSEMRHVRDKIIQLLPKTRMFPVQHEQALQAIIKLYADDPEESERLWATNYARELYHYSINVKHRFFFSQVSDQASCNEKIVPRKPSYKIGTRLSQEMCGNICVSSTSNHQLHGSDEQLSGIATELAKISNGGVENQFRSLQFEIAENWAVAAEYSADRNGHHCFRVARLSRELAAAMGFRINECVILELATRLHDVGKIVIDQVLMRKVNLGALDPYWSIKEHSLAGERMLGFTSDPVMILAARIARQHHEWWNGCGLPDGLVKQEICLEARICAVADAYVTLVDPAMGQPRWSLLGAKQQLATMAGIQLDPDIVNVFLRKLPDDMIISEYSIPIAESNLMDNYLGRAKSHLMSALGV